MTKKTNYYKSLEKQFKKQEFTDVYKLSEVKIPDLLSYPKTPWSESQKDIRRLDKMENSLIDGYEMDTKDGKKIKVKVPQRLEHLTKDPE